LNRLFPVSDVSCYRSSQVARLLASVNELRKGKDAAAERLCSTLTNGEVASYNPLKCLKFAESAEQI
jgi:hypothetical protein